MSINRFYVISPLALVALSACRSPYNQAVNGVISKGPLSNALVFLDLDGDNVLDSMSSLLEQMLMVIFPSVAFRLLRIKLWP